MQLSTPQLDIFRANGLAGCLDPRLQTYVHLQLKVHSNISEAAATKLQGCILRMGTIGPSAADAADRCAALPSKDGEARRFKPSLIARRVCPSKAQARNC